jgi:hypothetical protein
MQHCAGNRRAGARRAATRQAPAVTLWLLLAFWSPRAALAPATLSFSEKEALRLPACEVLGGWLAIALPLPLWLIYLPTSHTQAPLAALQEQRRVAQGAGFDENTRGPPQRAKCQPFCRPLRAFGPQHL